MGLGDPRLLEQLDSWSGKQFEYFLAELFRGLGEKVESTEYYDHGADLVLGGGGERTAVQVKRAQSAVGEKAVQAVVCAKPIYGCERAMVVTNSFYTPRARRLAEANQVTLWGRAELTTAILSFCSVCQKRVSESVRAWCLERPGQYGGRVYCFSHQRDPACLEGNRGASEFSAVHSGRKQGRRSRHAQRGS